jgi:peptidoglycan-N-acetylmuramic acid deacetylase
MCLTFDDGYGADYIKTIVNCLHENNVHCTFFIVGEALTFYPDLWRQAITNGNEICYHTMHHDNLTTFSDDQITADINKWNATAKSVLGESYVIPKLARLPGGNGDSNQRVLSLFGNQGYSVIAWGPDTYSDVIRDNTNSVSVINQQAADYVLAHAAVGAIQLQHFNKFDAPSVSLYIQTLKQKYTLGKISDALANTLSK